MEVIVSEKDPDWCYFRDLKAGQAFIMYNWRHAPDRVRTHVKAGYRDTPVSFIPGEGRVVDVEEHARVVPVESKLIVTR